MRGAERGMEKEVLLVHIEAVEGRVTYTGAPPVCEVLVERLLGPASAQDMARLSCGEDPTDEYVCSICLDPVQGGPWSGPVSKGVKTACGHIFHAECCRLSERVALEAYGAFPCPCCRREVTLVTCSYGEILLDSAPIPASRGPNAGRLLRGNATLGGVVERMHEEFYASLCTEDVVSARAELPVSEEEPGEVSQEESAKSLPARACTPTPGNECGGKKITQICAVPIIFFPGAEEESLPAMCCVPLWWRRRPMLNSGDNFLPRSR